MLNNAWIYIAVMAGVTYLIRVLPLTLIRKEIKNQTIRSFLFYVPYVTLAVMTFPAIIQATDSMSAVCFRSPWLRVLWYLCWSYFCEVFRFSRLDTPHYAML